MAGTEQRSSGTHAVTHTIDSWQDPHRDLHSRLLIEEQFAGQLQQAERKSAATLGENCDIQTGCREIAAWPSTFSRTQFTRDRLHDAIIAASGKNRSTAFLPLVEHGTLDATHDGYEYKHVARGDSHQVDYVCWQVRRSGFLHQSTAMREDPAPEDGATLLSLDATVAYTAEAIDYIGRFYEALVGRDMTVTVRLRLTSTQGRALSAPYGAEDSNRTCKLSEIAYEAIMPVSELRGRRAAIVTETVRDVLQQCSWRDPPTREIRALVDTHVTRLIYRHHRPEYAGQ